MKDRASHQAALVELGRQALRSIALDELFDAAVLSARDQLGVPQVAILELTGDGRGLLARAGVGLPAGVLGGVLPVGDDPNLPSRLQADLGSASSMQVTIASGERRFGWIEVHAPEEREFGREDEAFLRGVADILGAAAERVRHEDFVVDSEAQFRELADTTPALMWMTDAEGDVTFVNEGWRRFTGGAETAGVTFASSAHPDDREKTVRLWTEAMTNREEFSCEYRLQHAASGGYRWVLELGTPRFSEGEFVGYVGTATDIHERRTMEEALRASETIWRELADTAPAMMWTTDTDGLITFVNQGWLRFTGTTFQEEMGASWALGVHPEDADTVLSSWDEALAERREWEGEYRLKHHTGEYRWIHDRGVPRHVGERFAG